MNKLTIEHLAPYLPFGLTIKNIIDGSVMEMVVDSEIYKTPQKTDLNGRIPLMVIFNSNTVKPILRPLSDLTKEIEYGLQTYSFPDLFEIGDDGGFIYEYDHGNCKLIASINTISKFNTHHDINYLPYPVVNEMVKHHFDVFGLIEANLAIDINTLTANP